MPLTSRASSNTEVRDRLLCLIEALLLLLDDIPETVGFTAETKTCLALLAFLAIRLRLYLLFSAIH